MMNKMVAPLRTLLQGWTLAAGLLAAGGALAQSSGSQLSDIRLTGPGWTPWQSSSSSSDHTGSTFVQDTIHGMSGDEVQTASGWAGSTIGPGMINVKAGVSYAGSWNATSNAEAWFFEGLRITAEGQGTHYNQIDVTYSVLLEEHWSIENQSERKWLTASGGLSFANYGFQWANGPMQIIDEGTYTRLVYKTSVYNDQWMGLMWRVNATASASGDTYYMDRETGSAFIDLTYYWGGIQSVTDRDGNLLTYAVSADSGYDFRNSFAPAAAPTPTPAVPEPSSTALMAAGGVLLVVMQRRRRERAGVAATGTAIA